MEKSESISDYFSRTLALVNQMLLPTEPPQIACARSYRRSCLLSRSFPIGARLSPSSFRPPIAHPSLMQVSVATYVRRLRRRSNPAANCRRRILAIALISASFTALITRTLHLYLPIMSGATPSAFFTSKDSYGQDSIIPPARSMISSSIMYSDTIFMEAKGSETGRMMPVSSMSETRVKEVISRLGDLPSYATQESYKLEIKPNNGRRKVPYWALPPVEAVLYAKREIERAPIVLDDADLYAPLYWNVSTFKRSYELMERILKVYIYPDGSRPIFHTPVLQGIYASEGWFMKLIEESQQFVVKDPKKAHLFYLPYSSRKLRDVVYTLGSHNIRPLATFLRNYVNDISSKYPFWNLTKGSDHFLVACHDWGPYSTTLHTELCKNTIKALCNADTSEGIFVQGKDVSLPETTIKAPKRPLKYIGGKRVSQRPILAFYAGLMHGRVRPTLEKLWGNDTEGDIRIFRRLPNRVSRKMSYVEHMKSSRFCICPMGYEVNSPRIVEAIYYECVPVIIADNFALPFEEVLKWSTFSVVIAEKDIADLKNILLSIPLTRYLQMQKCVQKVQKHFLWHARPEKYDLFHLILHSIWFSRLNQIHNPL